VRKATEARDDVAMPLRVVERAGEYRLRSAGASAASLR
jgi:hypothetical protein